MTTEPWVSVDEVAKHLDVARDSVYRWVESRSLPAHRIGRILKFRISEVDTWVRSHDSGVTGESSENKQLDADTRPTGGL